jgi:hypothetical protein
MRNTGYGVPGKICIKPDNEGGKFENNAAGPKLIRMTSLKNKISPNVAKT